MITVIHRLSHVPRQEYLSDGPMGLAFAALTLITLAAPLRAQTIRVDATPDHFTNVIVPTKALGAGIDRLPYGAADKLYVDATRTQVLSAGWQPVSYRQNTELHMEAWHWNPNGTWSDPSGKGYFTGSTDLGDPIRHSYGYSLPHRGVTHDDGTDFDGYGVLTDGDLNSYWKSNPYLTHIFTGQDDSLHPQWVMVDFAVPLPINAIRIAWADPYARRYLVQYWTGEDPIHKPTLGVWRTFPAGEILDGAGGTPTIQLTTGVIPVRFLRILMTQSSNTCDTHGSADRRNCVGYAMRELFIGTRTPDGKFNDVVRHTPDQDQTNTYCSSVDPWHELADRNEGAGDQVGFDLFFTGGFTRGLPAMIPIAMLYGTPEDSVAQISYVEKRGYPISYIEMGEEPDGHYTTPEDDAELYIQWATALHRLDPRLKLGGPVFTGQNNDIETWPDASGEVSWTKRFLNYLRSRGHLADLAFFSFEHYPIEPCKIHWSSLYDEPYYTSHILQVWREDGVPKDVPMFITESNVSWQSEEAFEDIWGALWLADYVGSFLTAGGDAVYYFHYLPLGIHPGCGHSPGTFGMFSTDRDLNIQQPLSQYFASQLINREWVQPGDGEHRLFFAQSDILDGANHNLVTAYAALRPDGQWSLLVINKDQENDHNVRILFRDTRTGTDRQFSGQISVVTFGAAQYQWHPNTLWHPSTKTDGVADPDGPPAQATINATAATIFNIPKASLTVLRGSLSQH